MMSSLTWITNQKTATLRIGLLLFWVVGFSSPAQATGWRAGFTLGAWQGLFSQTGQSGTAQIRTAAGPGMMANAGFNLGYLFFEWNGNLHLPGNVFRQSSPSLRDTWYYSLLNLNVGLTFKYFEIYGGYESSYVDFAQGYDGPFSGPAFQLGVSFHLPTAYNKTTGLFMRVVYRKAFLTEDANGTIPEAFETRFHSLYLGLGYAYSDF